MPRSENTVGDWIIAPVTFGVGRIAKEDARKGPGREFVRSSGRGARITETPENAKTIIRWNRTEEELVRGVVPAGTTRANVNEEVGGRERVRPEPSRHVGVKEQRADTVVKRAKDALGATILLRRVGAGEAKDGAEGRK